MTDEQGWKVCRVCEQKVCVPMDLHECSGPPSMTGSYVFDHGETGTHPRRYEVQFAFEGETWFDDEADAHAAAKEYDRIVADIVHGDELRGLRRALAIAKEQVEEADVPFGFASAAEWQASELAELRRILPEIHKQRDHETGIARLAISERNEARANVKHLRSVCREAAQRLRSLSDPFSAPLAALADKLDAMSRGDGAS